MAKSLYSKEIPPACKYCQNGTPAPATDEILCRRKGVVPPDGYCRRYRYDILKRTPNAAPPLPAFTDEDFSLEP